MIRITTTVYGYAVMWQFVVCWLPPTRNNWQLAECWSCNDRKEDQGKAG